jgi:hypothetical protein
MTFCRIATNDVWDHILLAPSEEDDRWCIWELDDGEGDWVKRHESSKVDADAPSGFDKVR